MRKDLYEDLYNLENKHWWHISKRKIVQSLIKTYNRIENPKILDVGCGTGKNIEDLRTLGNVIGMDNSKEAIKFCKKRGINNVILGDIEKIPLKSQSLDIITLLDVLEHTDDKKALNGIRKILKKGGILIITVPAFSWLWSRWDEVLFHKRRYTKKSISKVLQSNNFKITYITYLYSFLVLPALVVRKVKKVLFKNHYPSDFRISPIFINSFLSFLSKIEFKLAQKINIPFGTTVLVVAQKNE